MKLIVSKDHPCDHWWLKTETAITIAVFFVRWRLDCYNSKF